MASLVSLLDVGVPQLCLSFADIAPPLFPAIDAVTVSGDVVPVSSLVLPNSHDSRRDLTQAAGTLTDVHTERLVTQKRM